jgi:hypothetical protein
MRQQRNDERMTDLGGKMEAIAMAHDCLLRVSSDRKVGDVRGGLAATHHHDGLALAELSPRLELRAVNHGRDMLNAGNLRNVGSDVQACTDSDGVALPLFLLAGLFREVGDDVAGTILGRDFASDVCDSGFQVDMGPQLKLCGVLGEIFAVADRGEEVRLIVTGAEVRKAGELLGGDKLRKKLCQDRS